MIRAVSTVTRVRDHIWSRLTHQDNYSQFSTMAGRCNRGVVPQAQQSCPEQAMDMNVDDHPAHTTTELTHGSNRRTQ